MRVRDSSRGDCKKNHDLHLSVLLLLLLLLLRRIIILISLLSLLLLLLLSYNCAYDDNDAGGPSGLLPLVCMWRRDDNDNEDNYDNYYDGDDADDRDDD